MWYIAFLLFAEKESKDNKIFDCETCNVLLEADNALFAYEKALLWGKQHQQNISYGFVGIEDIIFVEEERPNDGTEIAGSYSSLKDVWQQKNKYIPDKHSIKTIQWENDLADTPINQILSQEQIDRLKKLWENI